MLSASPPGDLLTVFESASLRIARRRASRETNTAVVAFAGVQGAFGGIPVEEFSSSLGHTAAPHDAWFVIDKTRAWYNHTAADIESVLGARLAGREVVTLGNSMGGFGALLFGEKFRAAVVLAICPQFSIETSRVPFETRWRDAADAIPAFLHPTCLPEPRSSDTRRYVLAGAGHPGDLAHAQLIRDALTPEDAVIVLTGHGHDLAQWLKRRGTLVPLLKAVMMPGCDRAALTAVLTAAGLDYEVLDTRKNGASDASKSG